MDKIIYKYRDWTNVNHQKLLYDRELYVSSPKDFNDPFDCRITSNFSLLNTDDKIREFVKRKINNGDLKEHSTAYTEEIENRLFERLKYHVHEEQNSWDNYTFKKQDDHYGVASFSEIWDSILMWGHYSFNHSGICVGFFEKKLIESGSFSGGGQIMYQDSYPELNPLEENSINSLFKETHTKAKDWSYEKEYRLFKIYMPYVPNLQQRKMILPSSCFAEIMVGVKFPKREIKEISSLAYSMGAKLYQVTQVPFKFELTRERIF